MAKKNKVIISVTNDLYTDQRVHKVCTFLLSQGYIVTLVGRKQKSSIDLPARDYTTKRMKLWFEKGALFYANYNIRLFLYLMFHKSDVLIANDLDTLPANYLAKTLKRKNRIIYDSHELYTEVPELIHRPKVQKIWLAIEGFIFPKLTDVITVNNSIAEIYNKKYNKNLKVVRNISPLWSAKEIRSKQDLGIPDNKFLIIIQGAGINIDRGAEEAIEAMKNIDAALMIVGSGDVIEQLKHRVNELNLGKKVLFFGKKPYDVMMNYTFHADIGLTLDKSTNLNYKFSLPNKVFDYMHTNTPIIATNIVEVAKVVTANKIGIVLDEFTIETLTSNIQNLIDHPNKLLQFKTNCKIAAEKENWEKETRILSEIYPEIE